MPLTRKPAPAPTRSIHQAEVQAAADAWAVRILEYVDTLVWRLWYDQQRWRRGVGVSVSSGTAQATLDPGQNSIGNPTAAYTIGSGPTWTTATIQNKAVLLVLGIRRRGPYEPITLTTNWFDGVLQSIEPSTVQRLPQASEPVAPAGTLTPKTFRERARAEGAYTADLVRYYITQRWQAEARDLSRVHAGVARAVNVAAKRVTVQCDPFPESNVPETAVFGFGWRKWTSALVGKRVRLIFDPVIGNYVDDEL